MEALQSLFLRSRLTSGINRHSNNLLYAQLHQVKQLKRSFIVLHQQRNSDEDVNKNFSSGHGPLHALVQALGQWINYQQLLVDKILGRSSDSASGSVAATPTVNSPLKVIAQGVHELNQKLAPVVDELNKKTSGFAFRYADTSPYNETTWIGIMFLLTNGLSHDNTHI